MRPSPRVRAWLAPTSALALAVAFTVVPTAPAQAVACVPTSDVVSGGYRIVQFKTTGSCTWDLGASREVELLVVGGGGAGASSPLNVLGGGGAGGVAAGTITVGGELTIIVGAGGAKETSCGNHTDGQASSITGPGGTIFVRGDGGGRGAGCSMGGDGTNGGSGAGSHPWNGNKTGGLATKGLVTGTTGITLYGNAGASALYGQGGGGGGGAGTAAAAVTGTAGGDGGEGIKSSITGTEVTYASGGGGSGTTGGLGGTNAGNGSGSSTAATAGVNGTGSGGGGGGDGTGGGAGGGSGIVVLKYLPDCAPTSSTVGDDTVWQFTTVGLCVWSAPEGVSAADVLIIGGGGGGGGAAGGGGGGAGGVLFASSLALSAGGITVRVGDGGAGGAALLDSDTNRGAPGGDSAFGSATALGGGGGGGYNWGLDPDRFGMSGGSGGGYGEVQFGQSGTASTQTAPSGYTAYGNAGGSIGSSSQAGSGGGGASAAGGSVGSNSGATAGAGGAGRSFDITGVSVTYAGGGGGGGWDTKPGAAGGSGGGGAGGNVGNPAQAGAANTGSGGGGSGFPYGPATGAAGGSGIVIVRSRPAVTSFSVSASSAGNGSAAASPTSVSSGESSTLTATANTGYAFTSWSCTGGGSLGATTDNPATLSNITADASCTASFTKLPDPQAISVTTSAPGSAAYGGTFPVAATSDSGLAVDITTSGACNGSGTGSATVTMSSSSGSCVVAFNQPGNANYTAAPEITQSVTATKVTTTVTYTGDRVVVLPASLKVSAQTTGAAFCTAVGYKLDRNPLTTGSDYILTPTSGSVSTSGWNEGVYELTVSYGGDTNCADASDTATITVAAAGAAASAGGFYTLGGSGRVSVGMTVRAVPKTTPTQYRGQILLINNGKWRLKGTVTTYGKSGSTGTIAGTGSLQWWDQTLNGGLGAWLVVASNATYTATMTATTKSSPGSFGVTIVYTPVAPQAALPNSAAQQLKGGRITLA